MKYCNIAVLSQREQYELQLLQVQLTLINSS